MTVGQWTALFPVDDFCKLVCLMDMGRSQNLLCVPESESCPLKNTGKFRYNPLSIKAVIPYVLLACQNHCHSGVAYGRRKKLVATASRSCWRHSMRQTSSVWGPVFVWYCVLNFISHRDMLSWQCWTVFHKETLRDVMLISIIAVTYHLGTGDVSPLSVYDVPAARLPQTNARKRVPVMAT